MKDEENKIKDKTHDLNTRIHLIIVFTSISSTVNLSDFYSLRNEEKLVVLLNYSSSRRVATSGIRKHSVATSSSSWISVSCAQIRSEYGFTPYSR